MKRMMAIFALIIAFGAALPLGLKATRWAAGTPALAAKVELLAERIDKKIDKDRMNWLQETMYEMRKYWTEQFIVEKNYEPRTMSELLDYMLPKDREEYIGYQEEYEDLREKNKPKDKEKDDDKG